MKAWNPTKAERAMIGPRPSLFPRPRTIVAIIRDKDERINVDRFRGISVASPQSVRLRRLGKYVNDLARQWAAYEVGNDPSATVLMADALEEIKIQESSETHSSNASAPRNEFAKDINAKAKLLAFKKRYERDNGKEHGWKAAACCKFLIDPATLNRILKRP